MKSTTEISVSKLKTNLLALDKELSNRLEKLKADTTQSHSADFEEQATERENDEVVDKLIDDTNDELVQIKHALNRIELDNYLSCEKCGEAIGLERLQAVPYATRCMKCA